MDLKHFIRDIPDFPSPGILFRDITPLLKDPGAFRKVIGILSEQLSGTKVTAIAAIESRGFIFAAPVAASLGLPFIPIRKPGKLPFTATSIEYALEYGSGRLEIHTDALKQNDIVAVIDDLLATGGTAKGAAQLITNLGAKVGKMLFVIELESLGGRQALIDYNIESILKY